MARKSVYDYKVKRGVKGQWLVTANKQNYRVSKGLESGTWYVSWSGATTLFNAGTLRDCILWICAREGVL